MENRPKSPKNHDKVSKTQKNRRKLVRTHFDQRKIVEIDQKFIYLKNVVKNQLHTQKNDLQRVFNLRMSIQYL